MDRQFTSVTLHGFPVRIELDWPFHRSEGGSDYYVVHGKLQLDDDDGLHADVALNLAQTVREALGSVSGRASEGIYASSSMRSMARRALLAISAGTVTRGESVSSDRMTLSSVIVFMKAHTAFGFTG